ncbi:hypothetical protein KV205_12290 [Streptomyces sp. SKN60]|uniref:hypothetical protein n=1 Tax=Streptomyces sp. SKN60 TaxID=2855506 RepID=UPI002244FF35|nr:hypothetical protein [Streptomyces sp. SKN60]MCX2181303.1 hypothetical protein [Streptomyces sp. SKN60]
MLPVLESRRTNTFTSTVVEDFIMSMEERSVGLTSQQNAYDTLKRILLGARRRGGIAEDPFDGVISPEYIGAVAIPIWNDHGGWTAVKESVERPHRASWAMARAASLAVRPTPTRVADAGPVQSP